MSATASPPTCSATLGHLPPEEVVDISYVQRLLGHRSISTTEIYTHVADAALKVRITERHPRRGIVRG
jgi:integrase